MDQGFLRDVQKAGWLINAVDETVVRVSCPRHGCNLKVNLRKGKNIPVACSPQPEKQYIEIDGTDAIRLLYRLIREELGLTIKEVEEMAGASVDYFAKAEKNNPSKFPNFQSTLEWGKSLGVRILAERGPLPAMSLRYLADSRKQVAARLKMQAHHRARREGGEQSGQDSGPTSQTQTRCIKTFALLLLIQTDGMNTSSL